jgi:hypothetical protein
VLRLEGTGSSHTHSRLHFSGHPPMSYAQGNRPLEILQIIQSLGPSCDQTVILG